MVSERVLTTFEMDGLLTEKDIAERHLCFKQCRGCSKWTLMDTTKEDIPCQWCHITDYDITSTISKRSYNPMNKRKVK